VTAPTSAVLAPPNTSQVRSSSRLAGVDGLRAFAALWVLFFHIRAFSGARLPPGLDLFVRSGSTGVSLFLVLSGFCLYAPFAGGRLGRFRTSDFFRRRCRRLLPAYYASLVAVLAAHIWAGGRLGFPRLAAGEVLEQAGTHVTLTHQLFPTTFYGLNGAYWSLGLEWELYLALPLLVLAVRRFGIWRTLAVVAGVTVTYRLALAAAVAAGASGGGGLWATVVLPNIFLGRWSEFALGMCAAELHSRGLAGRWLRPITVAALLAAAVGLLVPNNPLSHVFFGVVFFALLCGVLSRGSRIAAIFSWRPLATIGVMSYSLYLVHQPLVEAAAALGAGLGRSPGQVFVGLLVLLPLFLAVAWLLFVVVERRTLRPESVDDGWPRRLLFPRPPFRLRTVIRRRFSRASRPIFTRAFKPAIHCEESAAAGAHDGQVVRSK